MDGQGNVEKNTLQTRNCKRNIKIATTPTGVVWLNYRLTNREYRNLTGMAAAKHHRQRLHARDKDACRAFDALSYASAKVLTSDDFALHVIMLTTSWDHLFRYAFKPRFRAINFTAYCNKQRAIETIASGLVRGFAQGGADASPKTVLIVGNGCNTATSRGHDSAPGKALRKQLARHFVIIMSLEFRSSITSPCCRVHVRHGHFDANATKTNKRGEKTSRHGHKVRGLFYCESCNKPFDRDFAAAHNIRAIFHHHTTTKTLVALFSAPPATA